MNNMPSLQEHTQSVQRSFFSNTLSLSKEDQHFVEENLFIKVHFATALPGRNFFVEKKGDDFVFSPSSENQGYTFYPYILNTTNKAYLLVLFSADIEITTEREPWKETLQEFNFQSRLSDKLGFKHAWAYSCDEVIIPEEVFEKDSDLLLFWNKKWNYLVFQL